MEICCSSLIPHVPFFITQTFIVPDNVGGVVGVEVVVVVDGTRVVVVVGHGGTVGHEGGGGQVGGGGGGGHVSGAPEVSLANLLSGKEVRDVYSHKHRFGQLYS